MQKLKYPNGERVWVSYYGSYEYPLFIITSKMESRSYYYLYELTDTGFKKLGKSRSPIELEIKFDIKNRIK